MIINRRTIANNMKISAIETDKFKSGIITLSLTLPLEEKSYANSLILSGVLRRGTEKFPKMADINRRLDELYASCIEIRSNIIRNNLSIIFTAEFLDDRYILSDTEVFGGVLEIISQMLLFPKVENNRFDNEFVAQEKKCINDALLSEINNTRAYAATRCKELMNRENRFYPTVEGLIEQVQTITADSLYDFYTYVLQNSCVEFFYIGTESISSVEQKILKCFDHFNFKACDIPFHSELLFPNDFSAQKKTMSVSQGKLAMGFNTNVDVFDKDYYAALLFNEIFGGSSSSKLFVNIREEMNICYYCSSSYSIYSGNMLVSSGIDVPNYEIAKEAILGQLDDIRQGKISEFEFSSAKKSLENCYRQIYDNPLEIQAFYGGRSLFGSEETIDECRDKIMSVNIKDVIAVANKTRYIAEFFVEGISDNSTAEDYDD